MRIVCPNCASQYEVGEDAIPEAGRDVQCAKCSEIWFQERPMKLTMDETPLPLETSEEPSAQKPEITPTPEPQADSTDGPENTAVFRSLRREQPATTPAQEQSEPAPEAEVSVDRSRRTIAPEVQSILQEEAEFASKRRSVSDAPSQTTEHSPAPTPVTEKAAEIQTPAKVEKTKQVTTPKAEMNPSEGVTLASAKSLRDILESEAIESVDITEGLPKTKPPEPSLDQLGMKRPTKVQSVVKEQPSAPAAEAPDVAAKVVETEKTKRTTDIEESPLMSQPKFRSDNKAGKAVFSDIDELNTNLSKEDDVKEDEDDLIDFNEDEDVEKASRFSVGFLAACIFAVLSTTMYVLAPSLSQAVPATEGFFSSYKKNVDGGRMVLQDMYYQGGEPGFDNLFKNAKDRFLN